MSAWKTHRRKNYDRPDCLDKIRRERYCEDTPATRWDETSEERTMNEKTEAEVQVIENASLGDVLPGDHLTWEWVMVHGGLTVTNRREGIAIYQDDSGDWWTAEDMSITQGNEDDITVTIRRTVKTLPTDPGEVISAADCLDNIKATCGLDLWTATEAVLGADGQWHGVWREVSGQGVFGSVRSKWIVPGTWKLEDR